MACILKLKILSFTDFLSTNQRTRIFTPHKKHYGHIKTNETAESGSTSLSISILAQHRMEEAEPAEWKSVLRTQHLPIFFFLLWASSSMELWAKIPSGSWHTQGKARPSIQPQPHFMMWTSKCQRGAAGGSPQSRSEVISSKDFWYININNNILIYLRYFQFKMAGTKPIWSLSTTMVT